MVRRVILLGEGHAIKKGPRGGAAVRLALLALSVRPLAGCTQDATARFTAPPRVPGAHSVLATTEGDRLEAWAYALDDNPLVLDLPAADRVHLFYDPRTLETLGLRPGRLDQVPPEVCGATPLPEEAEIFALEPQEGGSFEPVAYEGLPTEVRTYRYQAPCPCYAFDFDVLEVPGRRTWGVAPALEGLLVATSSVFLHLDQSLRLTVRGPTQDRIRSVWAAPDGRVFMGGAQGEVWRSNGAMSLENLELIDGSTSAIAGINPLAGSRRRDEPLELYWLDSEGRFYGRIDGARRLIRGRPPVSTNQLSGLVVLGPGRAVALQQAGEGTVWFDARREPQAQVEVWPVELSWPGGLAYTEWTGVLLTTRATEVYQRIGMEWVKLPNPGLDPSQRSRLVAALDLDRGFLELRSQGWLQQWAESARGYCPPVLLPAQLEYHHLTPAGPGTYLASGGISVEVEAAGGTNKIVVVRLRTPSQR